jgi:hypothetical protein
MNFLIYEENLIFFFISVLSLPLINDRPLQKVLNDIWRTRLSRSMIWLLPHTLPPSPGSKMDRPHTRRLRKRDNLLTGEGVGKEPNHTTARKPGPLEIIQNYLGLSLLSFLNIHGYFALLSLMINYHRS